MAGTNSEHSFDQVPEGETTSGLHIWLIIVGGVIGVPIFIMSAQIGGSLGLEGALPVFLVGCVVATILGVVTSLAGAKTRLSTYVLTTFCFGRRGAHVVNVIIAISLIGWFAIIGSVFGDAASSALSSLGIDPPAVWVLKLAGCLLMIGVSVSGFKGIDRLALFLVPLMLLFLGHASWLTWDQAINAPSAVGDNTLSFSKAISAVIGSYIVGVVIQPDYSRFAKNLKHAGWSIGLALGVAFPVILLLSAVPAIATGEQDLILIMIALGIGLPAFLLLLLGAWSSNVMCLYSSGLAIATILPGLKFNVIVAVTGTIGTALALAGVESYFIDFLVVLGLSIPPIASLYVLEVFWVRQGSWDTANLAGLPLVNVKAFAAWIVGAAAGGVSEVTGVGLSGIGAIDSILLSAVAYVIIHAASRNKYVVGDVR